MAVAIDYFVPDELIDDTGIELNRARMGVKTTFTVVFWALLAALISGLGGSIYSAIGLVMTGATVATAPFVLRKTGKMEIAGHLIVTPIYLLLFWLIHQNGGLLAPAIVWPAVVPLLATLFLSKRVAKTWLWVVVASMTAVLVGHLVGYQFPTQLPPKVATIQRGVSLIGAGYTAWVILKLKDNLQTWLTEALRRDISRRKEVEQELRDARDAAIEASQAKSAFLANMSHELRTPLNAVIGYSEMIKEEIEFMQEDGVEGVEAAADFLPDLRRIRSAGAHLLSLINDILDLSKIEAGKMELHIEMFDVPELIEDIRSTIAPLAYKNNNSLEVEISDELRYMNSDVTKVRQVLFNLLSNACKFTSDGTVVLRVRPNDSYDKIICEIEDTGVGMTQDQLDSIFEAFTQADTSTTREFGGTGLGLTITRHFCALLDGDIDVESNEGEGSTFTVRLATNLETPGSSGADVEVPASPADTVSTHFESGIHTVLVIDDDPTMRDLLRRAIEREGFAVATAATGSEGLLLAEQLKPDAITLDVMMPSMDGWTLLSKLKEHPELCDLPVIMVTMVAESARGFALGADHYMVKPIDRQKLIDILNSYRAPSDEHAEVLVVEDDEPTRTLLRRTLQADGWQVVEAENGQIGLDALDHIDPSLVLLDLMMPKLDGFEFLRQFRSHQRYAHVPVIVVTAKELTEDEEKQLRLGTSEILTKGGGARADELLDQVREHVRRVVGTSPSKNDGKKTAKKTPPKEAVVPE